MNKITLLIVDDHALIRETWSFLLSRNDAFEVIADVGDGERAIDIARDMQPDIVLLDINMTPVDGFEVLKGIRKLSPGSQVIAVSMHSQPSYVKKMLRLGAKGYVTKNSSTKEMVAAILEVVAGKIYICQDVKNIIASQIGEENDDTPGLNVLTDRELEIASLLRDGLPSREIAGRLNISSKTVEVHRCHLLKKLKIKNVALLISFLNSHSL